MLAPVVFAFCYAAVSQATPETTRHSYSLWAAPSWPMEALLSAKLQQFISRHAVSLLARGADLSADRPFVPVIHRSLASGQPFRGVNQLTCSLTAQVLGFSSPYWLTLRQVIEAGGRIKRDQMPLYAPLVLWKRISWRKNGGDHTCLLPAKFIKIWHIEQSTLDLPPAPTPTPCVSPQEAVRRILAGLPETPVVRQGGDKAMYKPYDDVIFLPDAPSGSSPGAALARFLHELCHWSGHPSRLNRRTLRDAHPFGSLVYGEEELTAELAVTWMMAHMGIQSAASRNSAAYLKSWSTIMKEDSRAVFRLAGQAQKIVDYLIKTPAHADLAENGAATDSEEIG